MSKKLEDFNRPYAISKNQHAKRLRGIKLPTLDPAKQAEIETTKLRYKMSLPESLMGLDQWARKEDATDLRDRARHDIYMRTQAKREKVGTDEYEQYLASLQERTSKDPVEKRRLRLAHHEAKKIGDQYIEVTPDPEQIAQADRIFAEVAWDTSYPASVWRATEKLVKASREADHEVFERELAYVKNYMEMRASENFVGSMKTEQASAAEQAKLREVFGAPAKAPTEPEPTGPQPRKVEPGEFERWIAAGRPEAQQNGAD